MQGIFICLDRIILTESRIGFEPYIMAKMKLSERTNGLTDAAELCSNILVTDMVFGTDPRHVCIF